MNEEIEILRKELELLQKQNSMLTQAVKQSRVIKQKFTESTKLLKQKDTQLQELNSSLEIKVAQRTQELQKVFKHEQHLKDVLQITTEINEMLITSYSTHTILKESSRKLASNSDYSFVISGLVNQNVFEVVYKSPKSRALITEEIVTLDNSSEIIKSIKYSTITKSTLIEKVEANQNSEYLKRADDIEPKWIIILPLINVNTNEVYGVLIIATHMEDGLNAEEIRILENMSHDISNAINANKQKEFILAMERDKTSNYEETILAFVNIIEQRDTYTAGHTIRVAEYCSLIAKEMGYTHEEIDRLEKAAILHDIGKVATPDAILLKPGKLSILEYDLIKQHSETGYEMLNKVSIYSDLAEIIKYHHSRYDGHGYPKTASPDEIPMLSHIMIVADAFDAMTTNRIYRARRDVEEALEEVKKSSGTQFHPIVVQAALTALAEVQISNSSQMPTSELEQRRMAYFFQDSLTGLYNQDYLQILLNAEDTTHHCLNIIKTKNFSSYNKQYGWEKGNILLKQIANLLQELYPKSTVIRYHGDDFIILNKSHQEIDLEKILSLESIKNSSVTMKVVHHDMRDRVFLEDLAKREN